MGSRSTMERGTFEAWAYASLRMSALRTVLMPPRANVPAQHTRRTNAFVAARVTRRRCGLLPSYFGRLSIFGGQVYIITGPGFNAAFHSLFVRYQAQCHFQNILSANISFSYGIITCVIIGILKRLRKQSRNYMVVLCGMPTIEYSA